MCRKSVCEKNSPSQALPRQLPQRGSQAVKLIAKVFCVMGKFPTQAQSLRARQRLPLRGSWQSRQVLTEGVRQIKTFPPRRRFRRKQARQLPFAFTTHSRENAMPERPQTLRHCSIKNNFSAEYAQSATTTTAASGGNREELLGQRPARRKCRPRHEADAGSRNPIRGGHSKSSRPWAAFTASLPGRTDPSRLPRRPCCQRPPARRRTARQTGQRPVL